MMHMKSIDEIFNARKQNYSFFFLLLHHVYAQHVSLRSVKKEDRL